MTITIYLMKLQIKFISFHKNVCMYVASINIYVIAIVYKINLLK